MNHINLNDSFWTACPELLDLAKRLESKCLSTQAFRTVVAHLACPSAPAIVVAQSLGIPINYVLDAYQIVIVQGGVWTSRAKIE